MTGRPQRDAGDASRVNSQAHGQKNQPVTAGEGHTSSVRCPEGTGMGTESLGSRRTEQGQETGGEGQNEACERLPPAPHHKWQALLLGSGWDTRGDTVVSGHRS